MPVQWQIEVHGFSALCCERADFVIEDPEWTIRQITTAPRYPRAHIYVARQPDQAGSRVLAGLIARLMRELNAQNPHLHNCRGRLRTPAWAIHTPGHQELRGEYPTYLNEPIRAPADCPPWEWPADFWAHLAEARACLSRKGQAAGPAS